MPCRISPKSHLRLSPSHCVDSSFHESRIREEAFHLALIQTLGLEESGAGSMGIRKEILRASLANHIIDAGGEALKLKLKELQCSVLFQKLAREPGNVQEPKHPDETFELTQSSHKLSLSWFTVDAASCTKIQIHLGAWLSF